MNNKMKKLILGCLIALFMNGFFPGMVNAQPTEVQPHTVNWRMMNYQMKEEADFQKAEQEYRAYYYSEEITSGNFKYRIESDGTATINKYIGTEEKIVFPSKIDGYDVKIINAFCVSDNNTVKSITISEGIEILGYGWVNWSDSLESVHYPSTVTMYTGEDAMNVSEIPIECVKLHTITVNEKNPYLTVVNGDLYSKDMKTFLMHPPASTKEKVVIDNRVTSIRNGALSDNVYLKTVVLPDSLVEIGYNAFAHSGISQDIVLPKNCEYIGDCAFSNTMIKSIHIPAATTKIDSGAFTNTKYLSRITVDSANKTYTIKDDCLYEIDTDSVVDYPCSNTATTHKVPEGTKTIMPGAYAYNKYLKTVKIPKSVEEIGLSAFTKSESLEEVIIPPSVMDIGSFAFAECKKLQKITFQGNAPKINYAVFEGINAVAYYPEGNSSWTNYIMTDYKAESLVWKAYQTTAETPQKPYKITNVVTGVHVYWKATKNAIGYGVWRSENGKNGTYSYLGETEGIHYTDKTTVSGKTYYYKIVSMGPTGDFMKDMSPAIGITYVGTPDITSRINKAAGIQIGWNKINGATGYAIYRKSYSGTDAWVRVATIFGNATFSWTDTAVKSNNGTVYRYTVRALAGSDKKTLSGCRTTGRTMARLASRTLSSAVKASKNSIKCTWTTSSAVTGYEVRFMVGDKVYKTVTVGNYKTGVKTFNGLAAGKTYKVQVRSYKKVDGVGSFYSAWSVAKNVSL